MSSDHGASMAATKLQPPALPFRLVARSRLAERLDDGMARAMPLVLASAPAGSGKSTLLASWAASRIDSVAWLQVDERDADPARFWASVVAAIARRRPTEAAGVAPIVAGSQGDDRVVVPAIVNALLDAEHLVVVLDDYHLIADPDVHRGVEHLIDRCPPSLTIVISTRVDPPFRLGRLRVRGRVCEVRATDLRFGSDEATSLLGPAGDTLAPSLIDDLCARTEGWAAGLVLAGLSLERAADPGRFVEDFRGDDQLVAGYLGDEFLASLTAEQRRRLMETSVLPRLTGSLVDAVTGADDGASWLLEIAGANQLVVRLDSTGEWFRYHHLFHDLLLLEARRTLPDRLPELQRRAAEWFEAAGDLVQAVAHHLAAGDLDAARHLMRFVGPDLLGLGQIRTLRTLLDELTADAPADSVCALLLGWCEYLGGRYDEAQRWLDVSIADAPSDFDLMRMMPLRLNVAVGRGDVSTALAAARSVVDAGDLPTRPSELANAVGVAFLWAGFEQEAREALAVALDRTVAEGRNTAHVMSLVALSILEFETGDAAAAHAMASRAVAVAESFGVAGYHGTAPAYAVLARTAADPVAARADAERGVALARRAATILGHAFTLAVCGDTLLDLGDDTGATMITEARSVLAGCPDPGVARRVLLRIEGRHRLAPEPLPRPVGLVEALTERELAVLRYLPSTLSQRDIASELFVSLNTVKTHCAAIYRKLAVADRAEAVRTARELGLL